VGRSCRGCSRTADGAEVGSGEGGKVSQVGKSEVGKAWKQISQIRKSGDPLLRAQKFFSKPGLKPGLRAFPCRKPSPAHHYSPSPPYPHSKPLGPSPSCRVMLMLISSHSPPCAHSPPHTHPYAESHISPHPYHYLFHYSFCAVSKLG
jgi:hypothetical protein